MRILKSILLVFNILVVQNIVAQDVELTSKDSIVSSSWIFGIGLNAVDDAGSEFTDVFNVSDNWNIVPYPSRISVGRYFENGLGIEAIGSYNVYKEGKIIDGAVNTEDIDYFAIDLRASYDLNQILGQTGWFDPYVGIGAGYTDANNQGRGTFNASLGFRTWISDRWGLDFNSTGKWTMDSSNSTNHIQHAAGLVYQFGIEKKLSKKGEEKLALIKAMEEEEQRKQDSIAAAAEAERAARELAERLKREEEAANLAAAEKAKMEAENTRRNMIQEEINGLGLVYFGLNSSYLSSEDRILLDKLVKVLEKYPTLVIEVTSHSDSRGPKKYNQWLSERRVKRTADYLLGKGLTSNRLRSQAFGESQLTNDCDDFKRCSEEEHKENRRSEFKILQY